MLTIPLDYLAPPSIPRLVPLAATGTTLAAVVSFALIRASAARVRPLCTVYRIARIAAGPVWWGEATLSDTVENRNVATLRTPAILAQATPNSAAWRVPIGSPSRPAAAFGSPGAWGKITPLNVWVLNLLSNPADLQNLSSA